MNERLIELYDQAIILEGNGDYVAGELDPFKFAQLIVRECANHCDLLLDHNISSEWSRGTHDCSKAIKKHFGVEE
jgi:hypothetical protein